MSIKKSLIRGDHRGKLIALENHKDVPFAIKRVFYIFDVAAGMTRGGHAHYVTQQYLVAVSGSCSVTLNDGKESKCYKLESRNIGLFQDALTWGEMNDFSPDCVLLVLASELFDEKDYIHTTEAFQRVVTS